MLFFHSRKKKPVGGVSLFGGADLFNKPKGPTPAESERREQVEKLHTEQKRQPEPKVKCRLIYMCQTDMLVILTPCLSYLPVKLSVCLIKDCWTSLQVESVSILLCLPVCFA